MSFDKGITNQVIELKEVMAKMNKDDSSEKKKKDLPPAVIGDEIISEVPMIRCSELSQGARFDKKQGCWRLDSFDDYLEGYITNKIIDDWNQHTLNEIKKYIKVRTFDHELRDNPFNLSKPYLSNFKNGTYNILTGEMTAHNPFDYIGQSHNYEIDPTSNKIPTKSIEWLEDLTGDKESALFLMELIGYCFYRSYEPFQMITILQGGGGNGKSTFINILNELIGDRNTSNASLSDLADKNNRFAKSMLFQKEVNAFADIDADFLKSTSILKALTGWDKIFAEYKGKDPFMFRNFAKLIFSANKLPPFNDFTSGFERRLFVVPFPIKIDDDFKEKHSIEAIEKEVPLLAVHCMKMFKETLERGYFTTSKTMEEAKNKWLKESNHVGRFIDECCTIDFDSEDGDSSKNVYEEYQKFCFRESVKELSQPNFSKELESMGIFKKQSRVNGVKLRRYIHLKIKSASERVE